MVMLHMALQEVMDYLLHTNSKNKMNNRTLSNINEQKSKIGFVHGFVSIVGGVILSYVFMMLFSKFMPGDYGIKIVPSIVLTPIFMSIFGLWLLFSKTTLKAFLKLTVTCIMFLIILQVM